MSMLNSLAMSSLVALFVLSGHGPCGQDPGVPAEPDKTLQGEPDPEVGETTAEARAVAAGVRGAVGGKAALEDLPALSFDFVIASGDREVRRHILFDRAGARLRIEIPTARGQVVVLLDVESDQGVALLGSEPVEEDDQRGLQSYGRSLAENDLGWLLLPWRITDPGMYLGLLPDESLGDRPCRVLEVIPSEQVPLPPGRRYVIHVDKESFEVVRVAFVSEKMKKGQEPLVFDWSEWKKLGEARFSTVRTQVGGPQTIRLENLELVAAVDETLFEGLPEQ